MKTWKLQGVWYRMPTWGFLLVMMVFILAPIETLARGVGKNEFYPGDAVRITVLEIERTADRKLFNISGDYKVNSSGQITLPLIGNVKVIGHDRVTLAKYLGELFAAYFPEPYITTMPLIRITLMGAFNKPGSYRISPDASLWELIEMAEGPRSDCDLNSIQVERSGRIIIKNLLEEFEKGYSLEDIGIKSGDQIISKGKSKLGFSEIMNYTYFIMTAISLYLNLKNLNK